MFHALIRCIKLYWKGQQMHFGFVNVILLHSDHRRVLITLGRLQGG